MRSNWKRLSVILLFLAAFAFALSGCSGSDGAAGAPGAKGADITVGTVSAAKLTFNQLKDVQLDGKVLSVDTSGDKPVVKFQVYNKATQEGIAGLRTFSLHIAQLKPAANGSASYWQNYIASGLPVTASAALTSAPSNPTTDAVTTFNADGTVKGQGYSVVDNGEGVYTVTFGSNIKVNTNVPYDATLVHRVVVGVRSVAVPGVVGLTPGAYAGPINPLTGLVQGSFTNTSGTNLVYDFTPSTGLVYKDATTGSAYARDIVSKGACNACHYKINYGFPRGNNTSGHFGSRPEIRTCVVCHTPQLASGKGDMTVFIHKIHMGEELPATEALFWDATTNYNSMKYAQSIKNCDSCHQGTIVNSEQKFTAKVCTSCHNNLNFAAGTGHRPQTDDIKCATCHDATEIAAYHVPVVPPNADNRTLNSTVVTGTTATLPDNTNTNASYVVANAANSNATVTLPTGANRITYVISSVSRVSTAAAGIAVGNPQIVFKFQKDGTDVVFNTYSATGKTEMMDNFVGAPSVVFAWSVPQDGITSPIDYNATASTYIKNIWRGDGKAMTYTTGTGVYDNLAATAAGTLTGPVGGYYTLTMTGVFIPTTAKMLTGGVGYSYSLSSTPPLVQTNLTAYPYTAKVVKNSTTKSLAGGSGGLSVPALNKWKVATGYTGRRLIVDNNKCNACHGAMGVAPTYHSGQRNDAPTCTFCHTVNRTNSGWPVNINYDVHALHGGSMRNEKFSWEASAGLKYWDVAYPGVLKNCEMCHVSPATGLSNGQDCYSGSTYELNCSTRTGSTTTAVNYSNLLMTTAASNSAANPTFPVVGGPTSATAIAGGDTRLIASITQAPSSAATYDALNLALSPFVTPGLGYGVPFSYDATTLAGTTTAAAATTLVFSPITAACSGCHDSSAAKAHMEANGGTVAHDVTGTRAIAATRTEQCLVCHGPSNNVSFNETVPAIKTVHRWW